MINDRGSVNIKLIQCVESFSDKTVEDVMYSAIIVNVVVVVVVLLLLLIIIAVVVIVIIV